MPETPLAQQSCKELPKGTPALSTQRIDAFHKQLKPAWRIEDGLLTREMKFQDYYQTISSVVAIAMLAQSQNHHPDLHVGYNRLKIEYSTHSVGGLSENDFICAARIDQLVLPVQ
jgi:4a-hydroxytetrahydrobiopterin dehydratase